MLLVVVMTAVVGGGFCVVVTPSHHDIANVLDSMKVKERAGLTSHFRYWWWC